MTAPEPKDVAPPDLGRSDGPPTPAAREADVATTSRSGSALRFGAWCACAFLLAVVLRYTFFAKSLPLTGLTTALLFGAKWLADRRDGRHSPPFFSASTSLGLALCAPPLYWATHEALLGQVDGLALERRLEGGPAIAVMSPAAFFVCGAIGVALGGLVFARAQSRTSTLVLRVLSSVASALLAGLLVLAGMRLARHPTLDEYIGSLERGTWIDAPGMSVPTVPFASAWRAPGAPGTRRDTIGDLTVVRACEQGGCRLGLVDGPEPRPAVDEVVPGAPLQHWNDEIEILRHRGTSKVYLQTRGTRQILVEFRLEEGRWQPGIFRREDVLTQTSPPVGWVGAGLGGLGAIVVAYGLRRRSRRRWDRLLATAHPGVLDANGRLTLHSQLIVQLDGGATMPSGPVVLCADLPTSSAYRDPPAVSADNLVPGTLAELGERAALGLMGYDAAICALACLSAAALVAAASVSLVL